MPPRSVTIIGNWKMHQTIAEAERFVAELAPLMSHTSHHVGLAVPFTLLAPAAKASAGTVIAIGAQNVSDYEAGPYTGEISPAMILDAGGAFVLVGHSERRRLFHEDNAVVNRKLRNSLQVGLKPVCCIGETLEQHQSGKTHDVLRSQLLQCLDGLSANQIAHLTVAYEPVWAIGTNRAATPEMAQETQTFCRSVIETEWGKRAGERITILYGGSVNPNNAASLLAQPDVDGLLVGNASLNVDSFAKIVLGPI